MQTIAEDLIQKIQGLPDNDKSRLVDLILTQLDRPDPELDRIWADEAAKRWKAYKEGRLKAIPYEEVMARYRNR